jgi:hypothetical protein
MQRSGMNFKQSSRDGTILAITTVDTTKPGRLYVSERVIQQRKGGR